MGRCRAAGYGRDSVLTMRYTFASRLTRRQHEDSYYLSEWETGLPIFTYNSKGERVRAIEKRLVPLREGKTKRDKESGTHANRLANRAARVESQRRSKR